MRHEGLNAGKMQITRFGTCRTPATKQLFLKLNLILDVCSAADHTPGPDHKDAGLERVPRCRSHASKMKVLANFELDPWIELRRRELKNRGASLLAVFSLVSLIKQVRGGLDLQELMNNNRTQHMKNS